MKKRETLNRIKMKNERNKLLLNQIRTFLKKNKYLFLNNNLDELIYIIKNINEILQNSDWIVSKCVNVEDDINNNDYNTINVENIEKECFGLIDDDVEDDFFEINSYELYKSCERAQEEIKNKKIDENNKTPMLPVVKNELVVCEKPKEQNFIIVEKNVYDVKYDKWAKGVINKYKLMWNSLKDFKIAEKFSKLHLYKFFEWHPDGFYAMRFYSKKYVPEGNENKSKGDFGCLAFYKDGHIEYYLDSDGEDYKPKKFLAKNEIKNKEDRDIQLQILERLNWLIDNKVIKLKKKTSKK